jgi:hypothetical protein
MHELKGMTEFNSWALREAKRECEVLARRIGMREGWRPDDGFWERERGMKRLVGEMEGDFVWLACPEEREWWGM